MQVGSLLPKQCHVQHQKLLAETDIYLILNIRNVLIICTACILLILRCACKTFGFCVMSPSFLCKLLRVLSFQNRFTRCLFAQLLGIDALVLLSSVSPMPLIRFDASSNFIDVRDERKFIIYEKYPLLSSFPLSWVFKNTTFLSCNFAFSDSLLPLCTTMLESCMFVCLFRPFKADCLT